MRQHSVPLFLVLVVSFVFGPDTLAMSSASANSTDDSIPDEIENITVTASRTPALLQETGSSVTIIKRQEIVQRGAINLAELLREVPGLAVSQQGAMGSITQIRVRGAEANQVLVLIDGIEANDVAQGSEFNFAHMLTSQIQRVEIVRGPQSALWGSDALAGVINVITSPAGDQQSDTRLSIESGSFGTVNASGGALLRHSNGAIRISAERLDTQGTNIARQGTEEDGYRNTTLALSGQWHTPGEANLTWSVRSTDTSTEYDAIDYVLTGLPTDADYETDSEQLYGRVSLAFGDSEALQHRLSAFTSRTENINRTPPAEAAISRGTRAHLSYQTDYTWDRHVVTGVIELESEDYEQRGAATPFGDPNKNLSADTRSLATEYRYNGDRVDYSFSLRYDANEAFDDAATWRLTGAWHASDQTSLFGSVGKSVKNPTFTERFGFFDTFTGNPGLAPEHSLGWELGIRHALPDHVGQLQLGWFSVKLDDEINGFVFDSALGGFTAKNAAGQSDRQGVELQLALAINDWITTRAQYTWLDATEQAPAGNSLTEVRRPEHTASIGLDLSLGATTLAASLLYTGSQEDDFFPPFPPFQSRVTLPARTVVNLSLIHDMGTGLALTARVDNLFDKRYEDVYGFVAPGVGAYAGVRLAF
ncbi:MAG: TonB-dependent receptor [Proteobacteria bacterium]|jgi:vitamin B12 transporter|nr:TonB-dependent receptor [Pseudomonadota bacterium]MDA1302473.1 TonB-dependent receptor [Pseudomonadota bacterium]